MNEVLKKSIYVLGIIAAVYLLFRYVLPMVLKVLGFAFQAFLYIIVLVIILFVLFYFIVHIVKMTRDRRE